VAGLSFPKTDYSKIADDYDKLRPPPLDMWVNKIIQHGEINENSIVLDVGCGTGRFPLGILSSKKALIYALEPSINMLSKAVAKDQSKQVSWVQGDGQNLPFRDNIFNCIYMTMVIHHIENKKTTLKEIHRTLRKGGNCIIMTTSHYRIRRHLLLCNFPGLTAIDLGRFPSVPTLQKTMTKAGFKNVHYHVVQTHEKVQTEEFLERVRNKYISTLTLLSQEKFERGLKVFERRIREKCRKYVTRPVGFDFVIGKK